MKSFNEWLLNEDFRLGGKPQYHDIQILGWSLSKGTLPPWKIEGDSGLNMSSVFTGRASGPESKKVYEDAIKLRKDNPEAAQYIHDSINLLRRTVLHNQKNPERIRQMQYLLMNPREALVGNNWAEIPENWVAPDVNGGGGGNAPAPAQPAQQPNVQVQKQAGSNQVKCPKCGNVFNPS